MGIVIKKTVYEKADEGIHNVVLSRIEDIGLVETVQYGTKDQFAMYFTCLDQKGKDGGDVDLRYVVTKKLTPKSKLGQMLADLNITFSEDSFDTDDLVGVKCQVVVRHNKADNGNVYANITEFVPIRRVEQV